MPLIVHYATKADARAAIGTKLKYTDPSMRGMFPQFDPNGASTVANRPHITKIGHEWFGRIICKGGIITKVE